MLGQLLPCGGGAPIPLLKPQLLLGRHSYCDITLPFRTISGRHCEMELLDGYWFARDLGSSNGTRVNGIICASRRLMPDDVLALARYRYNVVYAPPGGRTPMRGTAAPTFGGRTARSTTLEPAEPPTGEALGLLLPCGGGDPLTLYRTQLVVGRHPDCDIVLPFATISGRHCQLEWAHGQWSVRDLGSRNGVRVDGVRAEAKPLPPGSILTVAHLRFQLIYTDPAYGPSEQQSVRGPNRPAHRIGAERYRLTPPFDRGDSRAERTCRR